MERAKDGKGLDRWLKMDRAKRRDEAKRLATLAELGERAAQIQAEALKMLSAGEPRSGIDHWTSRELFNAVRSLGLLPEGGK